jgi:hypothetical protein
VSQAKQGGSWIASLSLAKTLEWPLGNVLFLFYSASLEHTLNIYILSTAKDGLNETAKWLISLLFR